MLLAACLCVAHLPARAAEGLARFSDYVYLCATYRNTDLMKENRLLLADEAIALGALHAGLSGVYAYPGTPSTEITEFIQRHPLTQERGIHCRWCTNEKTAMEAALGMAYAGRRALVCMKHVGMNVCADAFVNAAITGVNGGLLVVAADDPSMHSSQNEQDSRFYGQFALLPMLEPASQQEAYDMVAYAYDLSERLRLPVLMRIVTRLAHSRSAVSVNTEARPVNTLRPDTGKHWVLLPAIARRQNARLIEKQDDLLQASLASPFNRYCPQVATDAPADTPDKGLGIVACGIAYNYVMECAPKGIAGVLKVSQYPLPERQIRQLAERSTSLLVVEDGQPFVETSIRALLGSDVQVEGRLTGRLPRTGELTPDNVAQALGCTPQSTYAVPQIVAPRPPALCQGCGHRDVYHALGEVLKDRTEARVFGDIGCYTLGALPPFERISTCVDMGASITMAKGAADAGLHPAIAVIGDSTFTHSGMTGLLDAVNANADITVLISDNLTTAMTGGQDSAGTSRLEAICLGLGVSKEHLHVVVPLPKNMEAITALLRQEMDYHGLSVVIARRECIQTLRRHHKSK